MEMPRQEASSFEPGLPRRMVIADPPESAGPLPTESHLVASLEHLRSRSTLRAKTTPAPAPDLPDPPPPTTRQPISDSAPVPPPAAADGGQAPKPTRRDRKLARQDAKQAKADDGPAEAGEDAARGRRGRRRPRSGDMAEAQISSPSPPAPVPEALIAESAGREAEKGSRRDRVNEAKQAVADQRTMGKERLVEVRQRAKSSEYLASKITTGDSTRRELRRHMRAAKAEAAAEVAAVKAEEAAKLRDARERVVAERRRGRRFARTGTTHLADSRVHSIRLGLAGSWIGLAAFAWVAWDAGNLQTDDYWIPLAAGSAALLVLSLVPWKRFRGRPITSILVFLWLAVLMGDMIATSPFHGSILGIFIASIWIVLYAGVLLPLTGYGFTSALVIVAFGTAVAINPETLGTVDLAWHVAGLATTTIIVGITVHALRTQAIHTAERLASLDAQGEALRRRESQLLQLYEVSRTIGAGEDMRQVLPELVARTAGYIEAKVGLVILHKPDQNELIALSPLWVAGQALEAEGYRFEVDGDSTAAMVFASGAAYLRNQVTEIDISRDQLLADLGVERVAAVPLQVEGATIGVLLVADKATDFTEADIAALELLSTPAGLVLNHLARYEVAQETGRRMSELAQLKSDFVSVVSHELRTPLTSVIGALSTLSRPELAPENPVALSLLSSASGQAKRLKNLIEDLLTVSKIDNQALPIRLEIQDLGAIVENLIARVPDWAEVVEVSLSPLLPKVAIDPDHFERVITNLLDNARKYASDSMVELTGRAVDDEVWISVIDNGEGIPYEYEQTIFERFTQIERPDTRFIGGTGLGLNIVKDLTEAMRGRVWLEATPGGGATFTLAFPRAEHDAEPTLEVGAGMLLVDPGRDRVEAPINMDDLPAGGESPIAE